MAELLIKLEPADNPNDLRAWGRGHVVAVMPDEWKWGSSECPPKFCVIKVTDNTTEQAKSFMDSSKTQIRTVKFDLDDITIPKAISDSIKTGVVSLTSAQLALYMKATAVKIG
jgi:hypothetical protein